MRRISTLIVSVLSGALMTLPAMGQTSKLVSVNNTGTGAGNTSSYPYSISADGRFVAFDSAAFNLAQVNDSNGASDVFVRDTQKGITILVSINDAGTGAGNGMSYSPVISPDGRRVLFGSRATDLVKTSDNNDNSDLFVRDLETGTTTLVTFNYAGTDTASVPTQTDNLPLSNPVMSADGRFIAFRSAATDLVRNDTNGASDIFVRDMKEGITKLVSINKSGTASGNKWSSGPSISSDGRYVAFYSSASDLVADRDLNETYNYDVFVRDLQTGTTSLVSINGAGTGTGNDASSNPVISADGRFVAFESRAFDLVNKSDNYGTPDIFVRDLVAQTTRLVSINRTGSATANGDSERPVISGNGRYVAFISDATDLVTATDTNSHDDVFVRDLRTGITSLVSANHTGKASGNGISTLQNNSVISHDGRFLAFVSSARDLVTTGDTNNASDLFLRDVQSKTTTLISVNKTGMATGNGNSGAPVISSNGRAVAFLSHATDLVTNQDTNNTNDVFVADTFTISSVTLNPSIVIGSNTATGRVTLSAPSPVGGTVIMLTDSNPAATGPSSVTVPAGATSATFTVNTSTVNKTWNGAFTATLGAARRSATLTVRPVGLVSVSVSPNPITGGDTATGTVLLEQAAPSNVTVILTDSAAATTIPASIVVPSGAASQTFQITTKAVTASQSGVLTASANGASRTTSFTVTSGGTTSCAETDFTMGPKLAVQLMSIKTDDFNRDGKPDLVGLNGSRVYIFLGNGTGFATSPLSFNVASQTFDLAVADFNLDGKRDLAIVEGIDNKLAIMLGDGTGRFGAPTHFRAGVGTGHIAVGHFNKDRKPDLAVTNTNAGSANTVLIMLGNGLGGFSSLMSYPVNHSSGIAVGDVNNDGNQDVVVSSQAPPTSPSYPSGAAQVLLGDGAGGFGAATSHGLGRTSLVNGVALADFNRDGKLDIAIATGTQGNQYSFRVAIMLGDGQGGFSAPTKFAAGQVPDQIAVADLNMDDIADLVVTNINSHNVSVLLGNGLGGFDRAKNYSMGVNTGRGVAVGDFNGDRKPDFAVAIRNSTVIMNNTCK